MANSDGSLIARQYSIDSDRPLAPVGGLAAFGVTDHLTGRYDLMALQVQRQYPARPRALQILASAPVEGLLAPVAYGSAGEVCHVICQAPSGASLLARPRPWSEAELLECVLRPAALVLEHLHARGLTHRGIRLDNVFQGARGQPVVLGSAWAAPPAIAQPALFEPPYSAMCLPVGRGDGTIADDVYALGVLLLCLSLGRAPLSQLEERSIIRRKLEVGSYEALAGNVRLPPFIGDLVRGMLAEDPEHRPTPTLLLDPASARGRRLAARPPSRAQRSFILGGTEIWNARSLAYAMALDPEQALPALRGGTVEHWLRRGLGDGQLAGRIEELLHHQSASALLGETNSDPDTLMRAICLLDPLAPLCWHGVALWPDGLGPVLAAAQAGDAGLTGFLEEMIAEEEIGNWAAMRPERCDFAVLRVEARQQHAWFEQPGQARSAARLAYLLNPLLSCSSPLVNSRWVSRLEELLPALEDTAGRVNQAQTEPMDAHLAAFISARLERRLDVDMAGSSGRGAPDAAYLAELRVLARLQSRFQVRSLPSLAKWFASRADVALAMWRNRSRRAAVAERLKSFAEAGHLTAMVTLLEDPAERVADAQEAQEAAQDLRRIDTELSMIAGGASGRNAASYRLGQEIAASIGLTALAVALMLAALG